MNSRKIKFFLVEDRKADTLLPLLEKHVHLETTIWSDEWAAYNKIGEKFYSHQTVKHVNINIKYKLLRQKKFIDPDTKAHTHLIECLWRHAKLYTEK